MIRSTRFPKLSVWLLVIMTFSAGSVTGAMTGAWIQDEEPTLRGPAFRMAANTRPEEGTEPLVDPDLVTFTNGFRPLVRNALPAVVSVTSSRTIGATGSPSPFASPFFRDFFGDEDFGFSAPLPFPEERERQGLGSGVIVDPAGYILTNEHVVRDASEVRVYLNDDREFSAEIVGTDPKTDIAVLRIDAEGLTPLPVGDSRSVEVGDFALAIGSPFGLNHTVTMGIVSARGRGDLGIEDYEDFIQTDAAINPGNSGGALINVRGELIGINTAIMSRAGGNQGVGFAVPSRMAMAVMDQIVSRGRVVRGWLGVTIQEVTPAMAGYFGLPDASGALIGDVVPGSPASRAGLASGDVIVALEGEPVPDSRTLRLNVSMTEPGSEVTLGVYRDGDELEIPVTLGELDEDGGPAVLSGGSESSTGVMSGVSVEDLTPQLRAGAGLDDLEGVWVAGIDTRSAASRAGLREGDVIVEVNRQKVIGVADYRTKIREAGGESLLLRVHRNGSSLYLVIEP
jgi:serine protease Do